jgi:hypothetical protein
VGLVRKKTTEQRRASVRARLGFRSIFSVEFRQTRARWRFFCFFFTKKKKKGIIGLKDFFQGIDKLSLKKNIPDSTDYKKTKLKPRNSELQKL